MYYFNCQPTQSVYNTNNLFMIPYINQFMFPEIQYLHPNMLWENNSSPSVPLVNSSEVSLKVQIEVHSPHKSKKNAQLSNIKHQKIQEESNSQPYDPLENAQRSKPKLKIIKKQAQNPIINLKQSLLQQFFTFLYSERKSKYFVIRIFKSMGIQSSEKKIKQCYSYYRNIKNNLQNSVRQDNLSVFKLDLTQLGDRNQELENFKTVARKLAFYFYSQLFPVRVLTSKKLKKSLREQKIQANLSMRRQLLAKLSVWLS